jgi:hypothetical protein
MSTVREIMQANLAAAKTDLVTAQAALEKLAESKAVSEAMAKVSKIEADIKAGETSFGAWLEKEENEAVAFFHTMAQHLGLEAVPAPAVVEPAAAAASTPT